MPNGFQVFFFFFLNTRALIARKPLFLKNGIENTEALDEIYSIYQTIFFPLYQKENP